MRLEALVCALALAALPVTASAGAFPARPPDVPLQHFTGLLTQFGAGMGLGWFTLRDLRSGKERLLRIGWPMKVDGHFEHCAHPDEPPMCSYWPSTVVIGKTVVTATCYAFHDTRMDPEHADYPACDQLDSVRAKRP